MEFRLQDHVHWESVLPSDIICLRGVCSDLQIVHTLGYETPFSVTEDPRLIVNLPCWKYRQVLEGWNISQSSLHHPSSILVGVWTHPFEKYDRQIGFIFPKIFGVNIPGIFELPPPRSMFRCKKPFVSVPIFHFPSKSILGGVKIYPNHPNHLSIWFLWVATILRSLSSRRFFKTPVLELHFWALDGMNLISTKMWHQKPPDS